MRHWGFLVLLLLVGCCLGAKPPTSHLLAWTHAQIAEDLGFILERCENRTICAMKPYATLAIADRDYEDDHLQGQRSYCYQIHAYTAAGAREGSKMVCTP